MYILVSATKSEAESVVSCLIDHPKVVLYDLDEIIKGLNLTNQIRLLAHHECKLEALNTIATPNAFLYGNALLTEQVLTELVKDGHKVIILAKDNVSDYDKEDVENLKQTLPEDTIQYNLVDKYKTLYDTLKRVNSDNVLWLNLSDTDSTVLDDLLVDFENLQDLDTFLTENQAIDRLNALKFTVPQQPQVEAKAKTTTKKEPKAEPKPIEPKAVEVKEEPKPKVEPKPTAIKVEPKPIIEPKAEVKPIEVKAEPKPTVKVEPKAEVKIGTQKDIDTLSIDSFIYVKVQDGSMVVLIPEGASVSKRVINGKQYTVATVEAPSMTATDLQRLGIKNS